MREGKGGQQPVPCEMAPHAMVNGATIPIGETAMTRTRGAVEQGHLRGTTMTALLSSFSTTSLLSNRTPRFHGAPAARD